MNDDLKTKLEALLFASARAMSADELAKLLREKDTEAIRRALAEIADDLAKKESSLMLIEDGGNYRFAVREKYLPFVRKVVTKTELPKTILETLAVIAYKAPILQSKLIKIRTNKAYDHLRHLEKTSYITREKSGRTKLIKLTQKFYTYFDISPDKLKTKFGSAPDLEKAIEAKEAEIAALHPELAKESPDEEGIRVVDEPETYDVPKVEPPLEEIKETIGGLEVYPTAPRANSDEIPTSGSMGDLETYAVDPSNPHEHRAPRKQPKKETAPAEAPGRAAAEEPEEQPAPHEETPPAEMTKVGQTPGVFSGGVPPDVQKKVDERVEAMLNPPPAEDEERQE